MLYKGKVKLSCISDSFKFKVLKFRDNSILKL
jgi:hypothetical protein